MKRPIRVLMVEDNPVDARIVLLELRRAGFDPDNQVVQTEAGYLAALRTQPDIILSDYVLPGFSGPQALALLNGSGLEIPFIIISGTIGEEIAVDSMRNGAADYLLKDRLVRLGPAVTHALETSRLRVERERAAEALQASETMNRAVLDSVLSHIAVLNREGTIVEMNRAWKDFAMENCPDVENPMLLTGLGVNYLQTCRSSHLTAASGEALAAHDGIRAVLEGRRDSFTLEYPCHAPQQERWFLMSVTPLKGASGGAVVSHTNITERKQTEERILEQAKLLDHAQDAILVGNLSGVIQYWNKSAERVYGWTAQEALGLSMRELLFQTPEAYDQAAEILLRKGEWVGEVIQRTKAGSEVRIEIGWTLVRGETGNPKSILSINTDITEKKKLEEHFFRAQRMESIGTLAGGIAHDLNNVFGPIIMAVDLFKLTMTDPHELSLLEMVEISAQRGAEMVKQILFFARGLESRRMLISPALIVAELRKMAIDTFPKSILLETDAPHDTWKIYGDHTQLYQVLLNLCVNARDAMPEGGKLKITARNIEIDPQYVARHPEARCGSFVLLTVADTGEGIPPEVAERIFEPFFTTKEIGKGTGLGLSTSLAIIKNHEGFIHLESRVGKGTTFKVGLPAVTNPEAMPLEPEGKQMRRGHGEGILVIDDEAAILSFTGQTLEAFGYRVIAAGDGAAGVAKYTEHLGEIDVVLTDMMMPVLDGAGTIRELMRINPGVKIIAASGLSAKGVEAAAGEGVRHFLAKPYTAETMLRMLHEVLHPPNSQ